MGVLNDLIIKVKTTFDKSGLKTSVSTLDKEAKSVGENVGKELASSSQGAWRKGWLSGKWKGSDGSLIPKADLKKAGVEAGTNYANGMKSAFSKGLSNIPISKLFLGAGAVGLASAAISAPIGVIGAIGKAGSKNASDFESALNQTQAIGGYTSEERKKIEEAALKYASNSVLSTLDVANITTTLATSGKTANENAAMIGAVGNLATANRVDTIQAAETLGAVLSSFGIGAEEATATADKLTSATTGSAQGLGDLQEALKMVGPIAAKAGYSLDDTLAVLMAMADKGIKGTVAATQLSNAILQPLTNGKARKELASYGVQTTDEEGNVKELSVILNELVNAFKERGLTEAEILTEQKRIFGKQGILAGGLSPEEIDQKRALVESSQGKSSEVADSLLKGLKGTFDKIKSSLDGLLTKVGLVINERLLPAFEAVAKWIDENADSIFEKLKSSFEQIPDITESVRRGLDTLKSWLFKAADSFSAFTKIDFNTLVKSIFTAFKALGDVIFSSISVAWELLELISKPLISAIKTAASYFSLFQGDVNKKQDVYLRNLQDRGIVGKDERTTKAWEAIKGVVNNSGTLTTSQDKYVRDILKEIDNPKYKLQGATKLKAFLEDALKTNERNKSFETLKKEAGTAKSEALKALDTFYEYQGKKAETSEEPVIIDLKEAKSENKKQDKESKTASSTFSALHATSENLNNLVDAKRAELAEVFSQLQTAFSEQSSIVSSSSYSDVFMNNKNDLQEKSVELQKKSLEAQLSLVDAERRFNKAFEDTLLNMIESVG